LWIPFEACRFQVNVESMEVGTTGMREAAVMLIAKDDWPQSEEPPVVVSSGEDFFKRITRAPIVRLPSDHERYDHMFPDHPLSKVRARLNAIADTLKFKSGLESQLKPFRIDSST